MKRSVLTVMGAVALALISGCTLTLTPIETGNVTISFKNLSTETTVAGTTNFMIRNLSGFGSIWDDTITYGDTSTTKSISLPSGTQTITGEVKTLTETNWTDASWSVSTSSMSTGGSYVLELRSPQLTAPYLSVLNLVSDTSLAQVVTEYYAQVTTATLPGQVVAIGQTLSYGSKSTPVRIAPFTSGSVTIAGSISATNSAPWTPGTWPFSSKTATVGDTLLLILN